MSTSDASLTASAAFQAAPGGKVGVVSAPGGANYDSPYQALKNAAGGFFRTVSAGAVSAFGNIIVPGGPAVIQNTTRIAANASEALKTASTAVSQGVTSGFKTGTMILVLAVGVYLWALFKPRG